MSYPAATDPELTSEAKAALNYSVVGSLGDSAKTLRFVDWSTVQWGPVRWLMNDRIPFGEVTICEGDGGIGKTTCLLDLAARVSRGAVMPDGTPCEPGNVILIAEEDRAEVLKARLVAAGADLARIHLVSHIGDEDNARSFQVPQDVPALDQEVARRGTVLVIIDALFSHFDRGLNANNAQDVRTALRPLVALAHASGAAITAIRHWRKGIGSASERGLGSVDIRNSVRSVVTFGSHPQEDGLFLAVVSKTNLGRPTKALSYRIESAIVPGTSDEEPLDVGRIAWGIEVDISADELASASQQQKSEDRTACEDARDAIISALTDEGLGEDGWVPAAALENRVVKQGQVTAGTFRRTRAKMNKAGFIERSGGGQYGGKVQWRFIESPNQHNISS